MTFSRQLDVLNLAVALSYVRPPAEVAVATDTHVGNVGVGLLLDSIITIYTSAYYYGAVDCGLVMSPCKDALS